MPPLKTYFDDLGDADPCEECGAYSVIKCNNPNCPGTNTCK